MLFQRPDGEGVAVAKCHERSRRLRPEQVQARRDAFMLTAHEQGFHAPGVHWPPLSVSELARLFSVSAPTVRKSLTRARVTRDRLEAALAELAAAE